MCGWKVQLGEGSVLSSSWWDSQSKEDPAGTPRVKRATRCEEAKCRGWGGFSLEQDIEGSGRWSVHLS